MTGQIKVEIVICNKGDKILISVSKVSAKATKITISFAKDEVDMY